MNDSFPVKDHGELGGGGLVVESGIELISLDTLHFHRLQTQVLELLCDMGVEKIRHRESGEIFVDVSGQPVLKGWANALPVSRLHLAHLGDGGHRRFGWNKG